MNTEERFERAKEKIIGEERERHSIGVLSEKTVHAVVKHYLEPDPAKQEVQLAGMVADIYTGKEIIEIQTRSFDRLRKKLSVFLEIVPVTVVFPIPDVKWLIWIDEESGEFTGKRKSPVKGNPYMVFPELYKIKPYLKHPNFKLKILMIDMEEYRMLNGWSRDRKKGSSRFDRIPVALKEEWDFVRKEDYMALVPYGIPEPFTAKDFYQYAKFPARLSGIVMNILTYLEVIKRVGKQGRQILYEVNETESDRRD